MLSKAGLFSSSQRIKVAAAASIGPNPVSEAIEQPPTAKSKATTRCSLEIGVSVVVVARVVVVVARVVPGLGLGVAHPASTDAAKIRAKGKRMLLNKRSQN